MVTVLVLIFLGCIAVTKESEMCDRVQFSFNGINTRQNFTKQSFEKNGHPVYYYAGGTFKKFIQTIIWQNNENDSTWISQTRPYSSNKITKTKNTIGKQLYI